MSKPKIKSTKVKIVQFFVDTTINTMIFSSHIYGLGSDSRIYEYEDGEWVLYEG